jgi:hypothetical protein
LDEQLCGSGHPALLADGVADEFFKVVLKYLYNYHSVATRICIIVHSLQLAVSVRRLQEICSKSKAS